MLINLLIIIFIHKFENNWACTLYWKPLARISGIERGDFCEFMVIHCTVSPVPLDCSEATPLARSTTLPHRGNLFIICREAEGGVALRQTLQAWRSVWIGKENSSTPCSPGWKWLDVMLTWSFTAASLFQNMQIFLSPWVSACQLSCSPPREGKGGRGGTGERREGEGRIRLLSR